VSPKPDEFKAPTADKPCPCGTGKKFGECCLPILKKQKPAADAEQLMRSRFSAHVAHDFEHLHRTHLESSKEPFEPDPQAGGTNWTRLKILSHEKSPKPGFSTVDFIAYFQDGEEEKSLHEKAEFQNIEGTWYYIRALREGPAPIKKTQASVGRNDPCPCGSGKKYKKCHGAN
jgi:SEC-C motif-containing protein